MYKLMAIMVGLVIAGSSLANYPSYPSYSSSYYYPAPYYPTYYKSVYSYYTYDDYAPSYYTPPSYGYNNHCPQYTWYKAQWYNGRWFPAGNYSFQNGQWFKQGVEGPFRGLDGPPNSAPTNKINGVSLKPSIGHDLPTLIERQK